MLEASRGVETVVVDGAFVVVLMWVFGGGNGGGGGAVIVVLVGVMVAEVVELVVKTLKVVLTLMVRLL